ncbi:MAG: fibronectin type III domain-containing protein [Salibacteraceae bacterium]
MRYIIIIQLLMFSVLGYAQNEPVFIRYNSDQGIVEVKWIPEQLINPEGANVYRSVNNNTWELVTSSPLKKGSIELTESDFTSNKELKGLKSLFDQPDFVFGDDPFLSVVLFQKVIPSKAISKYLGIQCSDIVKSKSGNIKYKVALIKNGSEVKFGESLSFDLDKDYLESGPTNIVSKEKKKSVSIGWKAESERYYGVNIYRANKGGGAWEKLNKLPILYTKAPTKGKKDDKPNYLYIDETVQPDLQYDYKLVSVDYFGEEAQEADVIALGAKDDIPPPAPTDLGKEIDHAGLSVILTWKAEIDPDQGGFNVLVSEPNDTSLNMVKANVSKDELSTFIQLSEVGRYQYAIEAFDETGNKSLSKIRSFDIEDKIPPTAPTNVVVSIDSGLVNVSWNPCNEGDLDGYYVFRRKSANITFQRLTSHPLKGTSFSEQFSPKVVASLEYMVASKDTMGNQSIGSEIVGLSIKDKSAPPTPIIIGITNDSGVVRVNWLVSDCHDLAGYSLHRFDSEDSSWSKINIGKILPTSTRFLDRNIENGTHYSYKLNAYDTANNVSDFSHEFKISIKEKREDLIIEHFNSAKRQKGNRIQLEWKVNNPEEVLSYLVYELAPGSKTWMPISGNLVEPKFEKKAAPGTYQYQLKIIDKKGKKILSEPLIIVVENKK